MQTHIHIKIIQVQAQCAHRHKRTKTQQHILVHAHSHTSHTLVHNTQRPTEVYFFYQFFVDQPQEILEVGCRICFETRLQCAVCSHMGSVGKNTLVFRKPGTVINYRLMRVTVYNQELESL